MAKKVGIKVELDGNFTSSMKKLGTTTESSLKKINAGAKKTTGAFKKLGGSIFSLKGLIVGVGVGLLVKKLTDLTLTQADLQDETIKTARAIGIEVEELTSLRRSAELGGASVGELDNGIKRLSRNIFDASHGIGDGAKAFDALGVAVVDNEGNLRATQDVLLDVADAFKEMDDGTLKNAQSQLLFGKSGGKLINTLNQGSEAIIRQRKEAEALGIIFSKEAAEDAEKFNDALTDLGNAFDGAFRGVAEDLLPKITPLIKDLTSYIADNQDEFKQFGSSLFNLFNDALPVIKAVTEGIGETVTGWDELISRFQNSSYLEELTELSTAQFEVTKELKEQEAILKRFESSGFIPPSIQDNVDALDSKLFDIKNKLQDLQGGQSTGPDTSDIEKNEEKNTVIAEQNTEFRAAEEEADLEFEKKFFLATQERLMKTATLKSRFATDNKKREEQELRDTIQLSKQIAAVGANAATDLFLTGKNAAKAKIGTSTAVATMRLYEDFPLPVALGLTPLVAGAGIKAIGDVDKQKFAEGGIVQGGTSSGDRISIGVNADEMVLTKGQQAELFSLANGNSGGGGSNITLNINAGAGTDGNSLAQTIVNELRSAELLGLEPQG